MSDFNVKLQLFKTLLANPQIIKAGLPVNLFLAGYLRQFRPQYVDGKLIIHSHLPPVNSLAYRRFINQHLLAKCVGPSHAQIAVTNLCPQSCGFCYNKERRGQVLTTRQIKELISGLKDRGVFWLGFTGGEPLLNPNLPELVAQVGDQCASKLFTTGMTATPSVARELHQAGLTYVTISLDHWQREIHDAARGYAGAFAAACRSIEIFLAEGMHVGVSAVFSRQMCQGQEAEKFLHFLQGLGLHEAWLSEAKPAVEAYWHKELVLTEEERKALVALQNIYNRRGKMTVNYLGHFEGGECFGCNAGQKMVYIDAFGEVAPCVFTPMTFGNVHRQDLDAILELMRQQLPGGSSCYINDNYQLFQKYFQGEYPLSREASLSIAGEAIKSPPSEFARRLKQ